MILAVEPDSSHPSRVGLVNMGHHDPMYDWARRQGHYTDLGRVWRGVGSPRVRRRSGPGRTSSRLRGVDSLSAGTTAEAGESPLSYGDWEGSGGLPVRESPSSRCIEPPHSGTVIPGRES